MSEYHQPTPHAEAVRPVLEDELALGRQTYETVAHLVSPEGVTARKLWLEEHMAGDDDVSIKRVDNLLSAARKELDKSVQASREGDFAATRRYGLNEEKLRDSVQMLYGESAFLEHYETEMALHQLEVGTGQRYWGKDAFRLRDALLEAVQPIDVAVDETPPAQREDAALNDYWSYLSKRRYIKPADISEARAKEDDLIMLMMPTDEVFEIPLANVLSASGMADGWADRDPKSPNERNNVTKSSIAVVQDYAERETPLPPAESVTAYVQPNGMIFFMVNGSNHRTAAAIARGEQTLKVDGDMSIGLLERNIINETALAHGMHEQELVGV